MDREPERENAVLERECERDEAARPDVIVIGAGLAGALIAARLAALRPAPRVLIVEAADRPFGRHTWSFHASDVPAAAHDWLAPLVRARWNAQEVRFPGFSRILGTGYLSVSSETAARALEGFANVSTRLGTEILAIEADRAIPREGPPLHAGCVIDARGLSALPGLVLGYQKFLGLELETRAPHGLAHPLIMDADVPQSDGYRFLYCLPFTANRVLVEDTRYSDGPALDRTRAREAILAYARARGWHLGRVVAEESGVLPIALAHDFERAQGPRPGDVPVVGMRAALFHPTTGYSLPDGVRVAEIVARHWGEGSAGLAARMRAHARARHGATRFYRLLSRMLFLAAEPDQRHVVLRRFYGLPRPLIERFYAGDTTAADAARILVGRPPVPLGRAARCLSESRLLRMNP